MRRSVSVVLNGTTLVKGGAIQACVAFVKVASEVSDTQINWRFFVSAQVAEQLRLLSCNLDERFRVFPVSPARNREARRALRDAVRAVGADAVFTFFGPAYVHFKQPHLCGVADAWVTHSSRLAYARLQGWTDRLQMFAVSIYKAVWFRGVNAWVVEAECARRGLVRRLRCSPAHIHIVANNCGEQFVRAADGAAQPSYDGKIRVLTLSAYYPHKNLELILDVAALLEKRRPGRFQFVLTLPESDPDSAAFLARIQARNLGDVVKNIGPVSVVDAPQLYASCHVAFLPSLLETFSANYPEAMIMRRPVVTSDLGFARDVCGNAALYVDPLSPESAASALEAIVDDGAMRERLVEEGAMVQRALPDQLTRYRSYREAVLSTLQSQDRVGSVP